MCFFLWGGKSEVVFTPADMSHSADRLLKRLPAQSAEPAAPLGRRLPELSLASRPAPCRESPDPAPRSPLPCVVCEVCESPSVLARASGSTMLPVLPFLLQHCNNDCLRASHPTTTCGAESPKVTVRGVLRLP